MKNSNIKLSIINNKEYTTATVQVKGETVKYIYDACSYSTLANKHITYLGGTYKNYNRYAVTRYNKQNIKTCELIMAKEYNMDPLEFKKYLRTNGLVVDHINGNTYDERLCNLRVLSRSENVKNKHDNHMSQPRFFESL